MIYVRGPSLGPNAIKLYRDSVIENLRRIYGRNASRNNFSVALSESGLVYGGWRSNYPYPRDI